MRIQLKIYPTLLTVISLLAFSGCSEEIEPEPLTYTQLLTGTESKTWQLTSVRILDDGTDSGNINVRQAFDACVADDQYVFYANDLKAYEVREGASKCSAADPEVYVSDSWSLINATATLNIIMPVLTTEFALPFIIKSLTEDTLVVEYYFSDVNLSYRFTFTARKG